MNHEKSFPEYHRFSNYSSRYSSSIKFDNLVYRMDLGEYRSNRIIKERDKWIE